MGIANSASENRSLATQLLSQTGRKCGRRELCFIEPVACIVVIAADEATMWVSRTGLYKTGSLASLLLTLSGRNVSVVKLVFIEPVNCMAVIATEEGTMWA